MLHTFSHPYDPKFGIVRKVTKDSLKAAMAVRQDGLSNTWSKIEVTEMLERNPI